VTWTSQASGSASSGPNQAVEADLFPEVGEDSTLGGFHCDDATREQEIYMLFLPKAVGMHFHARMLFGAEKIFLGQGRPLIRRIGFVADDCDAAGMILLPQRRGDPRATMPATDYQYIVVSHAVGLPDPRNS
jgi:hypothetical protein